ncbi:Deleted in lung and esophageal cancer protein 1 [Nowakowskiella sp. JEL0078]|nr:Deleted in lung and esophageal cancer protein 1 [Nowakowskiella sp. JEL0078]
MSRVSICRTPISNIDQIFSDLNENVDIAVHDLKTVSNLDTKLPCEEISSIISIQEVDFQSIFPWPGSVYQHFAKCVCSIRLVFNDIKTQKISPLLDLQEDSPPVINISDELHDINLILNTLQIQEKDSWDNIKKSHLKKLSKIESLESYIISVKKSTIAAEKERTEAAILKYGKVYKMYNIKEAPFLHSIENEQFVSNGLIPIPNFSSIKYNIQKGTPSFLTPLRRIKRTQTSIYPWHNVRNPVSSLDVPGTLEVNPHLSLAPIQNSAKSIPSNSITPPTFSIQAQPSALIFTDFDLNKTYIKSLKLQNKSMQSRRLRISTPSHKNFALLRIPQGGKVAPGLSRQVQISFHPTTRADINAKVCVTDGKSNVEVTVVAMREAPVLTLPDVLQFGVVRAGVECMHVWRFKNIGGDGCFELHGDRVDEDAVVCGRFRVWPRYFRINAGAESDLFVRYNASDEGVEYVDRSIFRIEYDNCQVLEVPIIGVSQQPSVRVFSIMDDFGNDISIGDSSSSKIELDFKFRNPGSKTIFTVKIQNDTLADLPFQWNIYNNPGFLPGHNMTPLESTTTLKIAPEQGCFSPKSVITFSLIFLPNEIMEYDILCDLVLVDNVKNALLHQLNMNLDKILTLRCIAKTTSHLIKISPSFLKIPGILEPGEVLKTKLCVMNQGLDSIVYSWYTESINSHVVNFHTTCLTGVIQPKKSIEFEFLIETYLPKKFDGALIFCFADTEIRVPVQICISIRPTALSIDFGKIDLGLMALGEFVVKKVPLSNRTSLNMKYKISTTDLDGRNGVKLNEIDNEKIDYILDVWPAEGIVAAGKAVMLELTFVPFWNQNLHAALLCHLVELYRDKLIQNDNLKQVPSITEKYDDEEVQTEEIVSMVELNGIVINKAVKLVYTFLSLSCFLGVPVTVITQLQNTTTLRTKFFWESFENDNVIAKFFPKDGELNSREILNVEILLIFKLTKEIELLKFICKIEGMVEKLGMALQVYVSGCKVRLEIDHSDAKSSSVSKYMIGDKYVPTGTKETLKNSTILADKNIEYQLKKENRNHKEKITNSLSLSTLPDKIFLLYSPSTSPRTSPKLSNSGIESLKTKFTQKPEFIKLIEIGSTLPITPSSPGLIIDFGLECPIYTTRTQHLKITNQTPIVTSFHIWVENYPTKTSTESLISNYVVLPRYLKSTHTSNEGFKSPFGAAYFRQNKQSRREIQKMHTLLEEGRGAAFHATPSSGVIGPFSTEFVEITAFNNFVGLYCDNLIIEVGESLINHSGKHCTRHVLPIRLAVRGCPIKITGAQLVSGLDMDSIDFGRVIVDSESVIKGNLTEKEKKKKFRGKFPKIKP